MKADAIFLLDRLAEFANEADLDDEGLRVWVGHVEPAMARLRHALAAAPQATDPRDRHILITPDRSHVEVRDMDHAMTLLAEQNIAIDTLTERLTRERDEVRDKCFGCITPAEHSEAIATLTAERDALREALTAYADMLCEHGQYFEGCGKLSADDCAGCRARALTTQPSKTETRDEE